MVDKATSEEPKQELPVTGAPAESKGAAETTPAKPASRTYTEEEWNKRQAAWDRNYSERIADIERKSSEDAAQLAAAMKQNFLRDATEKGLDVKKAEYLYDLEQQVKSEKETLERQRRQVEESSKSIAAHNLVKELGLSNDVLPELLEAKSPEAMEAKALRIKLGKQTEQPRVNTVTKPSSTSGVNLDKMSPERRIAWILEHQSK